MCVPGVYLQHHIRAGCVVLPFAHRLGCYIQLLRQGLLGHAAAAALFGNALAQCLLFMGDSSFVFSADFMLPHLAAAGKQLPVQLPQPAVVLSSQKAFDGQPFTCIKK